MSRKVEDYIGKKIHHLTILKDLGTRGPRFSRWVLVQCDCEDRTIKEIRLDCLLDKNRPTTSCGCYQRTVWKSDGVTHGMTKTREFRIWHGMKQRCHNPKHPNYSYYGGRGITVCDEWRESFIKFFEHVGAAPSKDHTIDRINNNEGYYPGNCRWATMKQQSNNLNKNRILAYNGESLTVAEWADKMGCDRSVIAKRLDRAGWSVERALSTPVVARNRPSRQHTNTVGGSAQE
jgi:hypothetical protein